jgi:hypothetical protein
MAESQRFDRVPVVVRMSAVGVSKLDEVAVMLGVSRSDVVRRAVLLGLPKLEEQARFVVETGQVRL